MKKLICAFIFMVLLFSIICYAESNTAEKIIELDQEWLSKDIIEELRTYLFPLEGKRDILAAQGLLLPLVESGNAEAQYYWGYIYEYANDIVEDNDKSMYWYELAAEQGCAKACLAIAVDSKERAEEMIETAKQVGMFELSDEDLGPDGCLLIAYYHYISEDYVATADWWKRAAHLGNPIAMHDLCAAYLTPIGVEKDLDSALEWVQKSAEAEIPKLMCEYADLLLTEVVSSHLVNKKYSEALPEYQAAAAAGDPDAMYNIAVMYHCGYGGLNQDREAYDQWILKAAEAGHPTAMYLMGNALYSDLTQANMWYLKAAEAGHPEAMYIMGLNSTNPTEAEEWLIKSADAGNVDAAHMIISDIDDWSYSTKYGKYYNQYDTFYNRSICIENEYGNEYADILSKAITLYEKAAKKGYVPAMNKIEYWKTTENAMDFVQYIPGKPVSFWEYSSEKGKWYKQAAEAGNSKAMFELACIYRDGIEYCTEPNYEEAMKWFIKAYAAGYDSTVITEEITKLLANKQGVNSYFEHYGELLLSHLPSGTVPINSVRILNDCNIRKEPSVSSSRVGGAVKGDVLTLIDTATAGWYHISMPDGTEGYISKSVGEILD